MKTLNQTLKSLREQKGWTLKELSQLSGIDKSLLNRFETSKRNPTEAQLGTLAHYLDYPFDILRKEWLANKIFDLVSEYPEALEALQVAESRLEYIKEGRLYEVANLSKDLQLKLERIDKLQAKWVARKPLGPSHLRRMQEFFQMEYTYESNRIEGNTLSLQETTLVVKDGLTISGKSMQEHLEAVNHAEAIEFLVDLAKSDADLNQRNLMQLHHLILRNLDRENAGRYRRVNVRIGGSEHKPPEPWQIQKLMEEYFLRYEALKNKMHPVLLSAEMHERLVTIHPFIDGNGRTSRLIMNLILMRNGFPLANLKGDVESRLSYYRALEAVQTNNEPQHFFNLVADAVFTSLNRHLEWIE